MRLRILDAEYGRPGIMHLKAVDDNIRHYTSTVVGAGSAGHIPDVIPMIGLSGMFLMDLPLFRDQDDSPGFYVTAFPETGNPGSWRGAVVLVSEDGGQTWRELTFIETAPVVGVIENALPDADWTVWDHTNFIDVRMLNGGELASVTEAEALNDANASVWGSEIGIFRDATLLSSNPNRYRLEHLIRGRRGSDWATGIHAVGDRFVFLDPDTIRRPMQALSDLNVVRQYRAVSVSQQIDFAYTHTFTNTGIGLKPYSPQNIAGARDGSNNLTITWTRRSRIWGGWSIVTPPPLGEATELYDVEIWDTGFTTLERTITPQPTSETASYSAAEQTSDGFTPGDPVGVIVYQISADVGRGFPGSAVV